MHKSAAIPNSDLLSWVGDAALQLVISEQLLASFGCTKVGDLTQLRATLISREHFRACAKELKLDQLIIVGKSILASEANNGPSDAMIAETFEAVFGALYVDGGLSAVRKAYYTNFPLQDTH